MFYGIMYLKQVVFQVYCMFFVLYFYIYYFLLSKLTAAGVAGRPGIDVALPVDKAYNAG